MAGQKVARFADNIEEITNGFSDDEVISLATTITRGLLKNKINSRQDALKVILNYSEDIPSLLRRKVFTRDKLLSYLYDKNVPIKLPVTKPEIIVKILQIWKCDIDDSQTNDNTQQILDIHTELRTQSNYDDFSVDSSQSTEGETVTDLNNQQKSVANTSNDIGSEVVEKSEPTNDTNDLNAVKLLAEQFSAWFYKLLNEKELSASHFFPDVVLNLTLNGDINTTNVSNDPAAVTNTLISVKDQYNLFFNPNLMRDCLNVQMDVHGLVMIIVGGTLHINNVCVGVFEQMFALARDPFEENNWKIKRTDLRLKDSGNNSGPSRLRNSENSEVYCTDIAK